MTTSSHVAIIGSGPAGCAAAITLGRHRVPAVVFERGQPGKDKPCGDAYLPDAVALMDELRITEPFEGNRSARVFEQIELWDSTRRIWTLGLDGRRGWIAPRGAIDQALRDEAGRVSEIRYGTAVIGIRQTESGWQVAFRANDGERVTQEFAAVIIASGAANALSRTFGISGDPTTGASISVYAHVDDVRAPMFQFTPMGIPGYGWVFPLGGGRVNIGVCATMRAPAYLRDRTVAYLDRWQAVEREPLRAGAGPMWSGLGQRWHHDGGLVSCGDAAGLVDPLTGEGIAPAMESGINAADAIASYLGSASNRALAMYSDWVRQTFSRRYSDTPVRRLWRYLNGANGINGPVPQTH